MATFRSVEWKVRDKKECYGEGKGQESRGKRDIRRKKMKRKRWKGE
jgi:hypothetical protein